MTLSMVSSVIQAVVGEEFAGSTGHELVTQCCITLLRIAILLATFMLANCTFNKKKHHNPVSPYNQATQSLLMKSQVMKASPKKATGFKGKRSFIPQCENDDALSTSVGSSDSESDLTLSDQEEDVKGTRISISELLRHRPPVGVPPCGNLKTMPVGAPQQRRACTAWDKARGTPSAQQSQAPTKAPAKAVPKMATSKAAKVAPKAPLKTPPALMKSKAPMSGDTVGAGAANPERIQALLSIICPEEGATACKSTSEARGIQRNKEAFPPGLEPSQAVL